MLSEEKAAFYTDTGRTSEEEPISREREKTPRAIKKLFSGRGYSFDGAVRSAIGKKLLKSKNLEGKVQKRDRPAIME